MNDLQFMQRALEISKKSLPECLPNPPVGCVLVKNGIIIAEGYTQAVGSHHAEVEAINQCMESLENVTAYVTLEPCAFAGRTPSCANMLASKNLLKVVVAIIDPDIRNSGKGIEILKSHAVEVVVGVAQNEVKKFITQYLGHS